MWASSCAGTAAGVAPALAQAERKSQRGPVVGHGGVTYPARLQRTVRMARRAVAAIAQTFRGIAIAVRSRARVVWAVAAAVAAFDLLAPVAILSLARRPADFFTLNPWLSRLPEYLVSEEPIGRKLSFLSNMAIAWVSADNHVEGIDWGFIVDVPTLAKVVLTALVFGTYFALWSYRRREGLACGVAFEAARPAGGAGALHG